MKNGKISVKGAALAFGVLWAVAVLFVGVGNLIWPDYGNDFLMVIVSLYPGYKGDPTFFAVLTAAGYALLDGMIGGALLAFLYIRFSGCSNCSHKE